ncbi:anaerobic sulfatase maturase [Natronincola ferrireducens]|uniref:Radical SAM core domain-containing protein n=1 Tax=Natronincola ferrireducens TaxID=393762 RepID=A0A1G9GVX6_9FIRM|nr:anaerobic sulfatase maturase [Natronincola ferrireducens]SDL04754.1 uncharacterized protein SAMN05660472_02502 [Natronincola ferrireducens]
MPPLSIMIKPASGLCNMHCKYCFYKDVTKNRQQESYGIMKLETLEHTIRKALNYAEGMCSIVFQGGEPTLAGLEFFKHVIKYEEKYNYKKLPISNSIQTNGYELNEEWAEFFRENDFLVGLSIDGTKTTHDAYRMDMQGKGTHNRIMEKVALLNKYKVEFNVLTVVNAETAKNIDDIYDFYKKNNLRYLQFIPCLDPLETPQGGEEFSLTPQQYGEFLKTLFDLWYQDMKKGNYIYIRYFENLVAMLMGYPPESCDMAGTCSIQYVVEGDGGVYPCDFYVLDKYKLGDINTESYQQLNKQRLTNGFITSSLAHHDKCKNCQYFYLCRGGCKRNKEQLQDGSFGENVFCGAFQDFFHHAMLRLQEIATMAKQKMYNR